MGIESKHIISLLVLSIVLIVLYMSYGRKDKKYYKKGKRDKSVKENFVDEIMREDNNTFSLFNWGGNDESEDNFEETIDTIENFPQSTPMNVIYTDTNGNLSNTSDLGLQNLTVNSDTKIGGSINVSSDAAIGGNTTIKGVVNTNTDVNIGGNTIHTGRSSFGGPMSDGIVNIRNRNGTYTHFNWVDGINYIRGNTQQDGTLNVAGSVNASESVNATKSVNATESVNGKSVNATDSMSAKTLNVSSIKIGNCILSEGDGGSLRISNNNGYIDIGTQNGGWGHIYTDRPKFAFNKPITDVANSPYKDYAKYDAENTGDITVSKMNIKDPKSDNKFTFEMGADDSRASDGGQRMHIKNKNGSRVLDLYQGEVKAWKEGSGEPVSIFSRKNNDAFWDNRSYLNVRDYGFYASTTGCGNRTDGHFGCNAVNAFS